MTAMESIAARAPKDEKARQKAVEDYVDNNFGKGLDLLGAMSTLVAAHNAKGKISKEAAACVADLVGGTTGKLLIELKEAEVAAGTTSRMDRMALHFLNRRVERSLK
ncbi:MAG: hypothetical protein ABIG20_00265 [archaeon]